MVRLIPLRGYFDVNAYFYIDDATGHGFLIDPGAQPDSDREETLQPVVKYL